MIAMDMDKRICMAFRSEFARLADEARLPGRYDIFAVLSNGFIVVYEDPEGDKAERHLLVTINPSKHPYVSLETDGLIQVRFLKVASEAAWNARVLVDECKDPKWRWEGWYANAAS